MKRYSVIAPFGECAVCGAKTGLEKHEIFYGTGNRKKSIEDGFVIELCHKDHNEPPDGIHFNKRLRTYWCQKAQRYYEEHIGTREQFRERYGKSYL